MKTSVKNGREEAPVRKGSGNEYSTNDRRRFSPLRPGLCVCPGQGARHEQRRAQAGAGRFEADWRG